MRTGIRSITSTSGRPTRTALVLALLLSTLLVAPAAAGSSAPASWTGSWTQQSARSTVRGTERGPWLAAASQSNCVLRPDGSSHCWGNDQHGLATGRSGPFTAISSGTRHNCGLRTDGSAECWGFEGGGSVTSQEGPYTQVSVGNEHACGLRPDGSAHCWGNQNFGQVSQAGPYTSLAAGEHHNCGLRSDRSLDCWGWNDHGQADDQPGPYTAVSAGREHTCALRTDGSAHCWGEDELGKADDQPGPYTAISASRDHTCALRTDGSAHCWGANWNQGAGADEDGRYLAITTGSSHTCALRLDGSVDCWGSGVAGSTLDQPGPFIDVVDHPFGAEVYWLAAAEVASGYGDGTFRPASPVTRMAMASFLWRFAGRPEAPLDEPFFADVAVEHPFYEAIQWMGESGLSTGSTNPDGGKPLYAPAAPVSRQAMAAFLWRLDGEVAGSLAEPFFADVTGPPFLAAVQWMAESGLSTGSTSPDGGKPLYKPTDPVSRQAMAAFLHRYDDL